MNHGTRGSELTPIWKRMMTLEITRFGQNDLLRVLRVFIFSSSRRQLSTPSAYVPPPHTHPIPTTTTCRTHPEAAGPPTLRCRLPGGLNQPEQPREAELRLGDQTGEERMNGPSRDASARTRR